MIDTRRTRQGSIRSKTILVIIAFFISIVSVSNLFLFHHLSEHVDRADDNNIATVSKASKVSKVSKASKVSKVSKVSEVAGLSCTDHGGPSDEIAKEMIFWSDIPEDSDYKSPFYDEEKYLTFEPDEGGWNNIRMSMETLLVLAHAMGRTLVLPPKQNIYLLGNAKQEHHKNAFTFNDFFHLDAVAMEHEGLKIITTDEFLKRKGVTGELKNLTTGNVLLPPNNQTDWDGKHQKELKEYLRTVGRFPEEWDPWSCVAVFPSSSDPKHIPEIQEMVNTLGKNKLPDPEKGDFVGEPTPVDAPTIDRLKEALATRNKLCIYDTQLQQEELIHLKVESESKARMLTHHYAFVFFQDWRQDLWSKRFVRDHIRYIDEIICAAARVVHAVREKAKSLSPDNTKGEYNSFHVRRGDFQYKETRLEAKALYEKSKDQLKEGSMLYIATDEKDKAFFDEFKKHYQVSFLDDYMDTIKDVNPNYYGMLDQLIAYKGEVFFGTWFSTLSGYVNRMRGHYSAKHKLEGYEKGVINSYYFAPDERKFQMRDYRAVKQPIFMREFPTSWRDIDKGIGEL